jgi:hypothetical protein
VAIFLGSWQKLLDYLYIFVYDTANAWDWRKKGFHKEQSIIFVSGWHEKYDVDKIKKIVYNLMVTNRPKIISSGMILSCLEFGQFINGVIFISPLELSGYYMYLLL